MKTTTGYPVIDGILEGMVPRGADDGLEMHTTTQPESAAGERDWNVQAIDDDYDGVYDADGNLIASVVVDNGAYADLIITAVNHHDALVAALRDELEAIRVWQSARGVPVDVRDGLQISAAKISEVLATVRQ
jgi:hypothetical protein